MLAQIIAIVSAAQSEKAPVARLADKIATVFVPVVILVAASIFCLRYFVLDAGNLRSALNCVCSTLVIACPCALGLATPTSNHEPGSGRAAELGVLFRGGEQLETACKTDTVVFDKTGHTDARPHRRRRAAPTGAAEAVRALRDRGMELWMISGRQAGEGRADRRVLGIENVLCEVRPADKSTRSRRCRRAESTCASSATASTTPRAACADIGVALGCGADIAISTADVMIVSSSMQSVQTVFDISAATMKNVRQNLIWAAVYNVICIPLAASGIINPSIAAAAMALSSNGVLLNALRLKKYEPRTI